MYSNKNIIIGIIIVAVIVIVAAIVVISVFKGSTGPSQPQQTEGVLTPQGAATASGASPVSSGGQVIAPTGESAKLDVQPGSVEAPQQSNPISAKDAPASAIKLKMTASGISPSSFAVKSGAAVTVSVTSGDEQTHVFMFDDPSLSAVAVGVGPGETRLITFNAPKAGTYNFHCDVPGHEARGETGRMTVQ